MKERCKKRGSAAPTADPQEMSKPIQKQIEFTILCRNLQLISEKFFRMITGTS